MMTESPATICHLLHTLNVGGAEVLAARLARRLAGVYRFVFACLEEVGTLGEGLLQEGFTVHLVGRRDGVDLGCARRLAGLLRRERVDLVHAHQYAPFFYSTVSRLFYRRPPVMFTEHGRAFPDYPRRKRILANRMLLERRDRVVGVGEAVRKALIDNEGLPASRVEVIYNGVQLSNFSNGNSDRVAARRAIGVGDENLVLIQVARLDPLKDHTTAIRSVARVAPHRPDVRLVLVGCGPEEARIRELIHREGLDRHVLLLGLRDDVARLLPAADLFFLTSVTEGIPVTLIEAMAAALPIVGTRVGGMGEVVEEGVTGLLAPAGDEVALAGCVLRMAGDIESAHRMGQLGRERARAMFSEDRMHEGYLRLYREMIGG